LSKNIHSKESTTYKDAGVNIEAGDELVERIKPFAKKTLRPEVLGGLGGFGSLFEVPKKYKNPILVSGTDGVGTKLKLAFTLNQHKTIGQDLVAMCVNDILVQGAEPLFFLDYFACGQLNVKQASDVIEGIAFGCELAGCSLVGGETAEMPGMYQSDEYDLAGFCVGVVEKDKIIDGSSVNEGDTVIGLASSGPHSNGYSLIRKLIEKEKLDLNNFCGDKTFSEVLLEPTRIYVKSILALNQEINIKAMAHITGGGLTENIPRVLPPNLAVDLQKNAWPKQEIFDWLKSKGNLSDHEMYKTFNCGIGMVLIVDGKDSDQAIKILSSNGESVNILGSVTTRKNNDPQVVIR
jgi:phosphoribosylformylglycinamidine cyclo-ligase